MYSKIVEEFLKHEDKDYEIDIEEYYLKYVPKEMQTKYTEIEVINYCNIIWETIGTEF